MEGSDRGFRFSLSGVEDNTPLESTSNNLNYSHITHSDASWRPGIRRKSRSSSAYEKKYAHTSDKRCESSYAFYRTKPYPSSGEYKKIRALAGRVIRARSENRP